MWHFSACVVCLHVSDVNDHLSFCLLWTLAFAKMLCHRICNSTGQRQWASNNFQQRLTLQCHRRRLFWDLTAPNPISAICPSVHWHRCVSCSSVSTVTFISYSDCHITQRQLSDVCELFNFKIEWKIFKKEGWRKWDSFPFSLWKMQVWRRIGTIREVCMFSLRLFGFSPGT